jgi:cytochrome c
MKLQLIFPHAAAIFMMAVAGSSLAAESSDAQQAKDLLNKAVAYLEKEGSARAFCAFNDPSGDFHKGPLYVFAINMEGVYFAHTAAPTLVGTSLRDTRDAAGQPFGKDIM